MTNAEFEKELKELDSRLSIIPNPNFPQLANIKLNGKDVSPIPNDDIREEEDPSYSMTFPNGMCRPHRSRGTALAIVKDTIERLKDKDYHDAFFGLGEYK